MATLGELAVQAIVTLGGGSAVAAALNGYFSRRATAVAIQQTRAATGKTTAEIIGVGAGTAAVQVDTSLDLLREMRTDLTAAREESREARDEARAARLEAAAARESSNAAREGMEKLRDWRVRQEHLNTVHSLWDVDVVRRLAAAGIPVLDPPPLNADGDLL